MGGPNVSALTEIYSCDRSAICDLYRPKLCNCPAMWICALYLNYDDWVWAVNILKKPVYDRKSIKARTAAIDWTGRHKKKQFSNLLDAALEGERNEMFGFLLLCEVAPIHLGECGSSVIIMVAILLSWDLPGRVKTVVENRDINDFPIVRFLNYI